MTTTSKTTAADTILAIDLGKYKSVACLYRSADDTRFTTFATSRDELARLIQRHRPAVVLVANTTSEAWKSSVAIRTDRRVCCR